VTTSDPEYLTRRAQEINAAQEAKRQAQSEEEKRKEGERAAARRRVAERLEVFLRWVKDNSVSGLPVFIKLNVDEPSTPSTLNVALQYARVGKGGGPMDVQDRWQPDGHGYLFDFWKDEDHNGFKVDAGYFLTTDMRCFRGTPQILPVVARAGGCSHTHASCGGDTGRVRTSTRKSISPRSKSGWKNGWPKPRRPICAVSIRSATTDRRCWPVSVRRVDVR
jgi:hypothetical protein